MKDFLQVDVCISRKFQEDREEFRDRFFTVPGRGYAFDDEGFSPFNKRYSFDFSEFAEAIRENDDLVEPLIDSLKESLGFTGKSNAQLADYIQDINKDHEHYNALKGIINGHVFKINEGKKLLLEYQDRLKSNSDLSFNDFLKDRLLDLDRFKEDYPDIGASVEDSLDSGDSIDKLVIVGNIFHDPEHFNIGSETFTLDNAKEDVFGYAASLIEDEHSYDIGGMEDRSELFQKGDFSGCTFSDIEFIGCDFTDVSFRDCIFDSVGFEATNMKNADLRGAKLTDTVFDGYRGGDSTDIDYFSGMKMNFADLAFAQKLGVLQISDSSKSLDLDDEEKELRSNFVKDHETPYKESLKGLVDKAAKLDPSQQNQSSGITGLVSGLFGTISSYVSREKSLEELERDLESSIYKIDRYLKGVDVGDLDSDQRDDITQKLKAIQDEFRSVKREYFLAQKDLKEDINDLYRFELEDSGIILDSTYSREIFAQTKDSHKQIVECTKSDLEDYKMNKDGDESFIAYYQRINADKLTGQVVPNFSGKNLSGMNLSGLDLSGVIMAKANLQNTNFSNCRLVGSCFEGATITNANFSKTNLTDVNMIGIRGQNVDFQKAEGARLRLAGCRLGSADKNKKSNFKGAKLYALDATLSDLENCSIEEAEMEKADFSQANMLYVDARKAMLRGAQLFNASVTGGDFTEANLEKATLSMLQADHANFTKAKMQEVEAINARFRDAVFNKVEASKGNFTQSDFNEVVAEFAEFTDSIMDGITAKKANFESAILTEVKARQADFTEAVLSNVRAERIDIREAVLKKAKAHNANLEGAVMEKVKAANADFTRANMNAVKARFGEFQSAIFQQAKLRAADIRNANLVNADLSKADVTEMVFQDQDGRNAALVINADLRDAIGAENLRALQEKQNELHRGIFGGYSRYGRCSEEDAARRYHCQKLGAMVLGAVAGGSSGYVLGGQLAAVGGGAVSAFCNTQFLDMYKDTFHSEYGFVNNGFGDRLAELGAIAAMMGAKGTEKAIDGALLGTIVSSYNLVQGGATALIGLGTAAVGGTILHSGVQQNSLGKKIIGGALTAIGAVATFFGFTQAASSIQTITMAAAAGGIVGAGMGAKIAAEEMYNFKERDGERVSGKKPEEVYDIAIEKLSEQWRRIMPTWKKLAIAVVCGVVAGMTGMYLLAPVLHMIPAFGGLVTGTVGMAAGLSGFLTGYLFEEKIKAPIEAVYNKFFPSSNTDRRDKDQRQEVLKLDTRVQETLVLDEKAVNKEQSQEVSASKEKHGPETIRNQKLWTKKIAEQRGLSTPSVTAQSATAA